MAKHAPLGFVARTDPQDILAALPCLEKPLIPFDGLECGTECTNRSWRNPNR